MWTQDWGTMIWGGSAVPTTDTMGLVLLMGALLGAGAVVLRRSFPRSSLGMFMVLGVGLPLMAARAIGIPHVFANGTVADADEVNANFAALETAVDALESPTGFVAIPESAFRSRSGSSVLLGLATAAH